MPPLRLQPLYKQRPWGGHRLANDWHKYADASASGWAESWEAVDLRNDQSIIVGGPFAGRTLGQVVNRHRPELLGAGAVSGLFPLLFKFLDAAETLSVQVHPNDEQARRLGLGDRGKSEAWVVLTAEPGSQLSIGLKAGIDRAALERHLADGTVADCLHIQPARPGDVFSVPAGTVHAIGAGVTLAELQQPSDITLRLFDWNRVDATGQPRELHIDAALQCIHFASGPVHPISPRLLATGDSAGVQPTNAGGNRSEELIRNATFVWRRHFIRERVVLTPRPTCRLLSWISGEAHLHVGENISHLLGPGETILIPAVTDPIEIIPKQNCTILDAEPIQ